MSTLCPHAEEHRSAAFAALQAQTNKRSLRKLDCYGVSKHGPLAVGGPGRPRPSRRAHAKARQDARERAFCCVRAPQDEVGTKTRRRADEVIE
jgi:hypothetical protein